MNEVTYDKAEIARTAKQLKKEATAKKVENLRNDLQPIPQEFCYPRTEVKECADGMYEFTYIDQNTMISRRVESTRKKNAKQSSGEHESDAGGSGVPDA